MYSPVKKGFLFALTEVNFHDMQYAHFQPAAVDPAPHTQDLTLKEAFRVVSLYGYSPQDLAGLHLLQDCVPQVAVFV